MVKVFNQGKIKPGLVSSTAGGVESPRKCTLQLCWLSINEGNWNFGPLGLGILPGD